MKKFFIFVPVQVVFENTATAYSAPNRTGQTGQAPLFAQQHRAAQATNARRNERVPGAGRTGVTSEMRS